MKLIKHIMSHLSLTYFKYIFLFFLRYEAFGGAGDGKSLHSVTFTPGQRVTLA